MEDKFKKFYKSATVWLNGAIVVTVVFLQSAMSDPHIREVLADHPKVTAYIVAAIAAANIFLRLRTTKPIETPKRVQEEL